MEVAVEVSMRRIFEVEFSLRNQKGAQTMKENEKKYKHLTYEDRLEIQECLAKGMTFKEIGRRIGKDQTTVSKEIKLHTVTHSNSFCKTEEICPRLKKSPFVCNGCDKKSRSSCPYIRHIYQAKRADAEYRETLVEARRGIPLNKESFYETDRILTEAIQKGQHLYHAIQTNNLPISLATAYRHTHLGYYSFTAIDLPRAVKFKSRKQRKEEHIPKWAKNGRTYEDFLAYTGENSDIHIVQLDTVIGRIGGKVIMTIHFTNCDFMIGLLLENKTAAEAADKITALKKHLIQNGFRFGDIAPILLTDNGGEFSLVDAFEKDISGILETHLFFCNPMSPSEKPEIEKNHTLLRDILPKGYSFDKLTQEDINKVFSHVNAVKRKQFNGKSAFDMFAFFYSQELANALGISFVPAKDVIQSPILLK